LKQRLIIDGRLRPFPLRQINRRAPSLWHALRRAALETVPELVPLDAEQARRGRYVALAARERGIDHELENLVLEPLEVASAAASTRVDSLALLA
jgi:hypothetical protein